MNKMEQGNRLAEERIDLQEQIANDRNEVNRERIATQAELQMMQMQMQRRG